MPSDDPILPIRSLSRSLLGKNFPGRRNARRIGAGRYRIGVSMRYVTVLTVADLCSLHRLPVITAMPVWTWMAYDFRGDDR
ncbi:MAG: hypothetical protein CM1200mP36_06880 [Gammaproteobacteria bacterium]|nr:MAG: hypothetical protein CM1200mP36_06880 [Gammaproteobacteria bacterium]